MSVEIIKSKIRDVVDFPQKGIVFRDLTTVFKDADYLRELSDMLTAIYAEKGITKVVGIESRGFIMEIIYWRRVSEPDSCLCANRENFLLKLGRKVIPKSMA